MLQNALLPRPPSSNALPERQQHVTRQLEVQLAHNEGRDLTGRFKMVDLLGDTNWSRWKQWLIVVITCYNYNIL